MNSTPPKIAVIIPHYNHNQYLKESVLSIVNQTYKNLEIIVIDDGSDEPPDDIMAEFDDDRITYKKLPRNVGKWAILNHAIANTDAEIITSHDADDVSLLSRIERQLQAMLATKSFHNLCGFHHCFSQEDIDNIVKDDKKIDGDLRVLSPDWVANAVLEGERRPDVNHYFTGDFETAGTTAMFFKELWTKGLRFNPPGCGLRVLLSEDSDFNFRTTALLHKTSILAEQLYCYRRHTSTNSEKL